MEIILAIVGVFWFIGALTWSNPKRQEAIRQQKIDELIDNLNNEYRNY